MPPALGRKKPVGPRRDGLAGEEGLRQVDAVKRRLRQAAVGIGVLAIVAGTSAAPLRTWTDARQNRIDAAFDRVADDVVVLRLPDGRELPVPLAGLSPADRAWITANAPAATAAEDPAPRPDGTWPRSVGLPAAPTVRVVEEDAKKRLFVYETEHYEFVSDSLLSANLVREFSRVFEVTWLVNSLLPLDLRPSPEPGRKKFRARIFTNKEDYFLAGAIPGSAGVYSRGFAALMLPLASLGVRMVGSRVSIDYQAEDYETLVHEITHQMMNHWLDRLPVWFTEGSAEYVALAEYGNGRISFLRQETRLRNRLSRYTGGRFPMLPLRALLAMDHATWTAALGSGGAWQNYASALALTYFFYHLDGDGKGTAMIEFLRAVERLPDGADSGPLVEKHLLRGRDAATLEEEVRRGLRRAGIDVEFTGATPADD